MRRFDQSLEEALGRPLRPEDRGSVETLNDLSEEQLREARSLAGATRLGATTYLQFYVVRCEAVDDFIRDVLEHDRVAAAVWGKRDVVCFPTARPTHWALVESKDLLAPLETVEGERWLRVIPTPAGWDWSGAAGAPGVVVRSAPYWFDPDPEADFADIESDPVEEIPADTLEIALRRWLASRVAWALRARPVSDCGSVAQIAIGLGVNEGELSAAARAAIVGLLRSGWPASPQTPIPGFTGPDDWYLE